MNFEGLFFDTDNFELTDKKLGEGSYGKVYIVKNTEGKLYAAKIIHNNGKLTGYSQMLLLRETIILKKLDHPAIVKFYGINFHSFKNSFQLEPTIITEYLPHGSLKIILEKEQNNMADNDWTPTKKYICILGIVDAMRYLHEKGILHRDLKPDNILIDENYYPRVCDFGLSRCFSQNLSMSMTGKVGTPLYMAPELLMDETHYGPEIDVYSFAILAYEIISRKVPFSENGKQINFTNFMQKVSTGGRPKFTDGFTEKMKDLISQCWSQNPQDRPSFKEIFEKLSTDFSYFDESIDEDEVHDYLDILKDETEVLHPSLSDEDYHNKINELEDKNKKLEEQNQNLKSENESKMKKLIDEKAQLKKESDAKIKKLTNENIKIKKESEAKIKKLTNENMQIKEESETKIKKLMEENMQIKEESDAKIKKLTNENMQIKEESETKIKKLMDENTLLRNEIAKSIKKIVNENARIKEEDEQKSKNLASPSDENSQHQHKKESKMKLRKLFSKKAQAKKEIRPNSISEIKEVPIVHDEISIIPGDFDIQDIKLLMLGSDDCGKKILLRQLRSIYIGFSNNDRNDCKEVIKLNLITYIKTLVESLQNSGRSVSKSIEKYVENINDLFPSEDELTPEVADKIFAVWNDSEIKKVHELNDSYGISENAAFFLDNVKRIAQENYMPTNEDILKTYIRTSGVSSLKLKINNCVNAELIDVGGSKCERDLWQRCFQGVDILIFVVSLTDFDQFMFEDDHIKRSMESINLFKSTACSPVFSKKPICLILSNADVFEKTLKENPEEFIKSYPDFTGNIKDVNACIEHVKSTYFRELPPDRNEETAWNEAIAVSVFDEKSVRDMFQVIAKKIVELFSNQ